MAEDGEKTGGDDEAIEGTERDLNARELRAVQEGLAATIMPVSGGRKVQFLSGLDFEEEQGTTFPTIAEAVDLVAKMLPTVNSGEARSRASLMERLLWLKLRRQVAGAED